MKHEITTTIADGAGSMKLKFTKYEDPKNDFKEVSLEVDRDVVGGIGYGFKVVLDEATRDELAAFFDAVNIYG